MRKINGKIVEICINYEFLCNTVLPTSTTCSPIFILIRMSRISNHKPDPSQVADSRNRWNAAFRRVGLVMPVADCESVFRYPATCTLSIHGQGVCIISSTASGAPRPPYSSNPILWSAYSSFGRAIGDGLDVPAADKEL